jgi:hypothetical protein
VLALEQETAVALEKSTPGAAATRAKVLRAVVVPSPSWLKVLLPLAHTVPSVFTKAMCCQPAETCATPVATWMGTVTLAEVPFPTGPSPL